MANNGKPPERDRPLPRAELRAGLALTEADKQLLLDASRGKIKLSPSQLRSLELRARLSGSTPAGSTTKSAEREEALEELVAGGGLEVLNPYGGPPIRVKPGGGAE